MEYVQHIRTGTTDGPVRVRFAGKAVATCLTMAAGGTTDVLAGDGVGASVVDRVPMVAIGRQGAQADFAAVLEPVRAGAKPTVSDVRLERTAAGATVTVQAGGAPTVITLTAAGRLTVVREGKTMLNSERKDAP